ncbi:MAG TPA: twin-arginine translocation signal domain-containing protein, partial [Candidatus Kapabacteria bacterium]|nr:twin-arginine translocation signal domain-containing protein [Candidatus Kapabacteria bacterium]
MNRRDFLKKSIVASAGVAAAPFLINGLPLQAFGANSPYGHLATASSDRILILVQLAGGNDGLNMIIPYQDPAYASARTRIGITYPQSTTKPEGYVPFGTGGSAFNGRMANNASSTTGPSVNLNQMFINGQVMVIQGVTYPNPSLSHFSATDIWMSGSDGNTTLDTGWFGRYLDNENPNYQQTIQNAINQGLTPDPLAIQIGYSLSNVLIGPNGGMGIALSSPNAFYNLVNNNKGSDFSDTLPAPFGGNEEQYVQTIIDESNIF